MQRGGERAESQSREGEEWVYMEDWPGMQSWGPRRVAQSDVSELQQGEGVSLSLWPGVEYWSVEKRDRGRGVRAQTG